MTEDDIEVIRRLRAKRSVEELSRIDIDSVEIEPRAKGPGVLGAFKKGLISPPIPWGENTIEPWQGAPSSEWGVSDAERASILGAPKPQRPAHYQQGPAPEPPVTDFDRIADPQSFIEKVSYDTGAYFPSVAMGFAAAPALGAAAGLSPLASLLIELPSAIGGLAAPRIAEEMGFGPLGQAVAGVGASVGAPTMITSAGPRIVGRLARAPRGAAEASQEVLEYMSSRGANSILPPGVKPPRPDDAYEAGVQLQRQFPPGVQDPKKYVNRVARERIPEVQSQFPDAHRQPSLSQAVSGPGVEDLGGGKVAKMELKYSNADGDYSAANYGRRLETMEWVQEITENEAPKYAGYASTRATARQLIDDADSAASRAWSSLDIDTVPPISQKSTDELVNLVKELDADPAKRPYMPREAYAILENAETYGRIPYTRLQSVASELSTTQRAAKAAGPMAEKTWRRGGKAGPIQEVVERILDEADPGDVVALRAARAATREAKALQTPIMREIIKNGDPVDV